MDTEKRGKMERYLLNSQKFLWGLGKGRKQEDTYRWLSSKGLGFNRGAYGPVTRQLLESPGIERLLKELVIPRVKELFKPAALRYLRDCWHAGTTPDLSLLKSYGVGIDDAPPFLEINTQFNFVAKWGEFAGVWFEEIEKLQDSTTDEGGYEG